MPIIIFLIIYLATLPKLPTLITNAQIIITYLIKHFAKSYEEVTFLIKLYVSFDHTLILYIYIYIYSLTWLNVKLTM